MTVSTLEVIRAPAPEATKANRWAGGEHWRRTEQNTSSDLRAATWTLRTSNAHREATGFLETHRMLIEVKAT